MGKRSVALRKYGTPPWVRPSKKAILNNMLGFKDPTSVSGLIGYFSTHDASGYTLGSGSAVATFVDRVGVCGNATSSTVARRPALVTNAFGSLPGLQFTDTGSSTDSSFQTVTNAVTTTEETIFLVMMAPTAMTGTGDYYIGSDTGSYGIRRQSSNVTEFPATGSTNGTQALRAGPLITLNQPIVLSGRRSAAYNDIALFENGAPLAQTTHTGTTRSGKFRFGLDAFTNYGTFTLGAALIYNRYLTETERLNVEEWLATKFNVYTPFAGIRDLYPTSRRYAAKNNVTTLNSLPLKKILAEGGQSNAEGGAPNAGLSSNLTGPIPGGYIWSPTNLVFEQLSTSNCLNGVVNQSGPELALMYDFGADFPGALMVKYALGNTSMLTGWNKTGTYYTTWVNRIKTAMDAEGLANGTRFVWAGVMFYQGEFDADDPTWAGQWQSLATAMIADFRSRIWGAANAPWALGRTRLDSPTSPSGLAIVQAAQDAVAATVPNVYVVGPWAVSKGDGIHGDANSIRLVANQAALRFGATTQVA